MAPNHSKLSGKEPPKRKRDVLKALDPTMNKIARGAAVFSDDFVEAMASGKNVKLPKTWMTLLMIIFLILRTLLMKKR